MIFALGLFLVGLLFCWLAFVGWRNRHAESISLLEAGILKATGDEPLPLTRFDRWLQTFQLIMITLFGPSMLFLGGYGFLSEIGAL
ncbi:hypothetical protein [Qipengyuania sp.]|uniref:hypothetical protein n=1 Tax=Qipengyuania sp. TaxID=2004515 RepID=UPI00351621FE